MKVEISNRINKRSKILDLKEFEEAARLKILSFYTNSKNYKIELLRNVNFIRL